MSSPSDMACSFICLNIWSADRSNWLTGACVLSLSRFYFDFFVLISTTNQLTLIVTLYCITTFVSYTDTHTQTVYTQRNIWSFLNSTFHFMTHHTLSTQPSSSIITLWTTSTFPSIIVPCFNTSSEVSHLDAPPSLPTSLFLWIRVNASRSDAHTTYTLYTESYPAHLSNHPTSFQSLQSQTHDQTTTT